MLWQLFPIITVATFIVCALAYLLVLAIDNIDNYYPSSKKSYVFWALKGLEGCALLFVIECSINLMRTSSPGGFFHTSIMIIFSILIPIVILVTLCGIAWILIMVFRGIYILTGKINFERFVKFLERVWNSYVQANKDYAEIIAENGILYSMVNADTLRCDVDWMRRAKIEEERKRKREREEMSKKTRQAEKELSDAMVIAEGRKLKLWYPLGDNDEV